MIRAAPRRGRSLTWRLGWRLAAVSLSAMLLAAAAVAWRAVATVQDLDDSALQAQAALIAARLPDAPAADGTVALPDSLTAQFRASDGDNLFLVYFGARLAAASTPAAFAAAEAEAQHEGFFRLPAAPGHPHGMIGLATAAGRWRIVTLQGQEQSAVLLHSLAGHLLAAAVWLLLPIGAVSVLVGVLTLRAGLRPLRRASATAALVGPARPGARLPVADLPAEVAPLVGAVNQALERLEQALDAQRAFMAEAAHALRTPLAVLTARLDLTEGEPDLAALRRDADRMGRLVGQLLRMARLEGLPLEVAGRVDLHAVAVAAISDLVPLALRRGVELALLDGPASLAVQGNAPALALALTNLIENALAYAPTGSAVEVRIAPPGAIEVLDRGPGVPAALRTRIFRRFERGPEAAEGGSGLGLAIVAEIAARHGGHVAVHDRPGGGAAFVLTVAEAGAEAGCATPTPARPPGLRDTAPRDPALRHACAAGMPPL